MKVAGTANEWGIKAFVRQAGGTAIMGKTGAIVMATFVGLRGLN